MTKKAAQPLHCITTLNTVIIKMLIMFCLFSVFVFYIPLVIILSCTDIS